MHAKRDAKRMKMLYKAFQSIKKYDEFVEFINDLCTPQEIHVLGERLEIALLLYEKAGSYKTISELSDASLVTVTRVARFLKYEKHGGYRNILEKIKEKK